MNVLRRLVLGFCTMVLGLSLLGLAWSHVINASVRDKDTVKSWFEESDFYNRITDSILEQAENSREESLPVNEPEVKEAIDEAFSPEFLKSGLNNVLDGFYAWAEGSTEQPQFRIDITEAKKRLIDGLSDYAVRRASELPPCTQAEAQGMAGEFDVLEASCIPAGVSPQQAGESVRSELASSRDFLPDTTFNLMI